MATHLIQLPGLVNGCMDLVLQTVRAQPSRAKCPVFPMPSPSHAHERYFCSAATKYHESTYKYILNSGCKISALVATPVGYLKLFVIFD